MDKDQARFILRSFRPDGADAADPDFAEALQLAVADVELGAWLTREREFDGAVAAAMKAQEAPEGLREEILAIFSAERGDLPQAEDSFDAAMIGAMATLCPPANLRLEALAAMERTALIERRVRWRRMGLPAAAAAGVVLALVLFRNEAPPRVVAAGPAATVPVELVEAGFLRTFTTPFFSVDPTPSAEMPVEILERRKLPCSRALPPGLKECRSVGCRELVIDGKRGSLVCFDQREAGTVHLIMFKREDVCGKLPCQKAPEFVQRGQFALARWSDDRHVFMLVGSTGVEELQALF